jgi:nicotinamide-nucleotide amidase
MKVEIISIGDELVFGAVLDTNSAYIGAKLAEAGADVKYRTTVGDDPEQIEDAVRRALGRTSVVIVTGGLGPTRDDVTKKTISQIFDRPLVLDEKILDKVKEHFQKRNLQMPAVNASQAMIPERSQALPNPVGTAPAIVIQEAGLMLVMLPGVPSEMKPLFDKHILPLVSRKARGMVIVQKTLHTTGLTESNIEEMLRARLRGLPRGELAYLPRHTGVDLKLTVRAVSRDMAARRTTELEETIESILGDSVWGKDDDTLEQVVGLLLTMRRKTISVAESCTGGLIMDMITNVPGSSSYFAGGLVAYSNDLKAKKLRVSKPKLDKYGAVSCEVAVSMAQGVRKYALSDLGLSVTGIAGPTGATETKPVGLVCMALAWEDGSTSQQHNFLGTRREIKEQSAVTCLDMLRRYLLKR